MNRDDLESLALSVCEPCVYYDLLDCMDSVTDEQLVNIIKGE